MNIAIEIQNVSKGFHIHHEKKNSIFETINGLIHRERNTEFLPVLKDISLSIKKGETVGIMGMNGSGKTTLLKLISKIYNPDTGTIITNGTVVPLLQLGIAFHPELNPIDNIITYGILLGYPKEKIKSLIPKILKYAELEKFSNVKIKHFSSGMYARLAFSTAITVEPDILILDEILAVGDVFFRNKCILSIKKLIKTNRTVLLVAHDPKILLELCDRIVILKNGTIDMIGKPKEAISHYLQTKPSENDLGLTNSIGDKNYRAYVGPPEKYDLIGAGQFNLLTLLGLRENHFLLDIGCGSLRGGRLFIPYLLSNRYYGIEPNRWLIKEGIHHNLGEDIIKNKEPHFDYNSNFNFKIFNTKFDFILAQSIFSHTSQDQMKKCIFEAKKVMKKTSIFVGTYFEGNENYAGDKWIYPGKITYTSEFIQSLVEESGLFYKPLKWKHPNGQTWFIASNPEFIEKIPTI